MGQKERERQIGNSDPQLMPRVPSCKHDSSMCKSFSLTLSPSCVFFLFFSQACIAMAGAHSLVLGLSVDR